MRGAVRPLLGAVGAALLLGGWALSAAPALALTGSPTSYDGELFSLTNQDRASNGLGALADNATLAGIAESRPYYGCSVSPIYGRAADMINRDYFAHQIPGCSADGGYVWPIMSADGVAWRSAGENVGWNSGSGSPAVAINSAFMASPEHRANILGNYNQLGIGSWFTAGTWTYPGAGTYSDVDMFAEEFALLGAAAPPPPRPTPPPSSGGSGGSGSGRHSTPTPAPTAVPTPAPTPKPRPPRRGVEARYPASSRGLLSNTIEQVISGYLDE